MHPGVMVILFGRFASTSKKLLSKKYHLLRLGLVENVPIRKVKAKHRERNLLIGIDVQAMKRVSIFQLLLEASFIPEKIVLFALEK